MDNNDNVHNLQKCADKKMLVLLQPVHTNGKYANCVIYNLWIEHVSFICTGYFEYLLVGTFLEIIEDVSVIASVSHI